MQHLCAISVKTGSNSRCSHIPGGVIYSCYGNATPANICRHLGPIWDHLKLHFKGLLGEGWTHSAVTRLAGYSIYHHAFYSSHAFYSGTSCLKENVRLIVYIEWLDYTV